MLIFLYRIDLLCFWSAWLALGFSLNPRLYGLKINVSVKRKKGFRASWWSSTVCFLFSSWENHLRYVLQWHMVSFWNEEAKSHSCIDGGFLNSCSIWWWNGFQVNETGYEITFILHYIIKQWAFWVNSHQTLCRWMPLLSNFRYILIQMWPKVKMSEWVSYFLNLSLFLPVSGWYAHLFWTS